MRGSKTADARLALIDITHSASWEGGCTTNSSVSSLARFQIVLARQGGGGGGREDASRTVGSDGIRAMIRHKHHRGEGPLDTCSSAAWFDGWREPVGTVPGPAPVAPARIWLAAVGWRRHGLLGIEERPRRGSDLRSGQRRPMTRYEVVNSKEDDRLHDGRRPSVGAIAPARCWRRMAAGRSARPSTTARRAGAPSPESGDAARADRRCLSCRRSR